MNENCVEWKTKRCPAKSHAPPQITSCCELFSATIRFSLLGRSSALDARVLLVGDIESQSASWATLQVVRCYVLLRNRDSSLLLFSSCLLINALYEREPKVEHSQSETHSHFAMPSTRVLRNTQQASLARNSNNKSSSSLIDLLANFIVRPQKATSPVNRVAATHAAQIAATAATLVPLCALQANSYGPFN